MHLKVWCLESLATNQPSSQTRPGQQQNGNKAQSPLCPSKSQSFTQSDIQMEILTTTHTHQFSTLINLSMVAVAAATDSLAVIMLCSLFSVLFVIPSTHTHSAQLSSTRLNLTIQTMMIISALPRPSWLNSHPLDSTSDPRLKPSSSFIIRIYCFNRLAFRNLTH